MDGTERRPSRAPKPASRVRLELTHQFLVSIRVRNVRSYHRRMQPFDEREELPPQANEIGGAQPSSDLRRREIAGWRHIQAGQGPDNFVEGGAEDCPGRVDFNSVRVESRGQGSKRIPDGEDVPASERLDERFVAHRRRSVGGHAPARDFAAAAVRYLAPLASSEVTALVSHP